MVMCAIGVQAQQLREGHFFKTFDDGQPMAKVAPALFDQWFTLPKETEWREVSRQTDNIGMERIEYRQYVGGIEVEYSQVLLHVRDGRVQSANGTVMERQRTPASLQHGSIMHRGGTPTDLLGRKLLLIDTDNGYRYATMCISADRRYKVYHDVETGEELKRVPLMHRADPPAGTPATITGKSVYSGDKPLDVTKAGDGMYYLYDQQRNIHTLVGAYLPTYDKLIADGKLFDYFPSHDYTYADFKDSKKFEGWLEKVIADFLANNMPAFEKFIKDYTFYVPNQSDVWTAHHLKSLTLSDLSFGLEEDSYLGVTLFYSLGTEETTGLGKLWSGAIDKPDTPFNFPDHNKIVIIPNEGATMVVSVIKSTKDEETLQIYKDEKVVEVVPLSFASGNTTFDIQGDKMKIHLECEANASTPLTDIHWGMGRTVDFYKKMFGRNGYDNNNSPVYNLVYLSDGFNSFVNCELDNAAAMANNKPYPMIYGLGGEEMNPVTEISVMAHEFTHIITDQTARLEYKSESGALNESFSDIMGISVKKWNDPSYKPWFIAGDGAMVKYSNMRDMKNPRNSYDGKLEDYRSPGYYHGYDWKDTSNPGSDNDNGGVHINSGVQNRWYVLLCEGDTGDNSNFVEGGKPYSMTGIGMDKALQIAYRTLIQYATNQAQYADIRLCHIQAAKDLYGDNSTEVQAVIKAWDLVGVTDSSQTGIVEAKADSSLSTLHSSLDWYTLDGRQLPSKPTAKGIYIYKGKKQVVK